MIGMMSSLCDLKHNPGACQPDTLTSPGCPQEHIISLNPNNISQQDQTLSSVPDAASRPGAVQDLTSARKPPFH